jgi:hypothetical protein
VTTKLREVGEARIRGYLFVLGRSLSAFLPRDVARDALREIESHVRERLGQIEPQPDERGAVERVLQELGPPLRVAQAYSAELTVEEALTTGRAGATLRALWHLATTTAGGFAATFVLFAGYVLGASFIIVAALKPVFPDNVGLFVVDGVPRREDPGHRWPAEARLGHDAEGRGLAGPLPHFPELHQVHRRTDPPTRSRPLRKSRAPPGVVVAGRPKRGFDPRGGSTPG